MLEEKAMVKLLAKEMKKNHFRLILKRKKKTPGQPKSTSIAQHCPRATSG